MRLGGCAAKLSEVPSCLHPWRRSSHARDLTDRRAIHCGRILVRPPRTVRNGAHWMTVGVRTLTYRSRASPATKLPAFMNLARCRASADAIHFSLARNYTAFRDSPPRTRDGSRSKTTIFRYSCPLPSTDLRSQCADQVVRIHTLTRMNSGCYRSPAILLPAECRRQASSDLHTGLAYIS